MTGRENNEHGNGVDHGGHLVIKDDTRQAMVVFAQDQLGKEYAHRQLFKYAAMHLFGIKFSVKDKGAKGAAGTYFCSHYVAEIYRRHGCDLDINLSDLHTSPKILAESTKLDFVGTLKKR